MIGVTKRQRPLREHYRQRKDEAEAHDNARLPVLALAGWRKVLSPAAPGGANRRFHTRFTIPSRESKAGTQLRWRFHRELPRGIPSSPTPPAAPHPFPA